MKISVCLKSHWNRALCRLDGADVTPFTTLKVDEEMKKTGWQIDHDMSHIAVLPYPPTVGFFNVVAVTNPRGEKVTTSEQYLEYRAARRAAAQIVYGLK